MQDQPAQQKYPHLLSGACRLHQCGRGAAGFLKRSGIGRDALQQELIMKFVAFERN
ncbi:MAG: hypothetical protein JWP29_1902, partial [Rhodoferax sp.]|nr:hypothetical protein [Rhodoferax sp.]